MYIVGIDIAKRKHEAAVIDGDGAVVIKPFSFTNNCSGYNRLLSMLKRAKLQPSELSFAMEATGHYWLALFTRLQKEGFRVQVINPVQTNSIRSFYIRQAKTDPRDALLIAVVIRFGHFSKSTLHPENIYEPRELCRGRHAIVSMQADVTAALACIAPLWPFFCCLSTLFGNGGAVLFSNAKGEGNETDSRAAFTVSFALICVSSLIVWLVILLFDEQLLRLFAADDALLPLALRYLKWLKWGIPLWPLGYFLGAFIRNGGAPTLVGIATVH